VIPRGDWKHFEDLYVKIQEEPKKNIESLKQFYDRYPEVPEVANLLAFALLKTKKRKKAEALIEKTYLKHPDTLTARINYADQCLRLGLKEKIPEIFNQCFDLNTLYPDREYFYYSEFRGFMTVMGFYHLEIEKKEKAEEYYQLAFQVDPLHPSVAALERNLSKTFLIKKCLKALQNLARISKNP
jgi:tetratricopeptide (TPR) repeat protein